MLNSYQCQVQFTYYMSGASYFYVELRFSCGLGLQIGKGLVQGTHSITYYGAYFAKIYCNIRCGQGILVLYHDMTDYYQKNYCNTRGHSIFKERIVDGLYYNNVIGQDVLVVCYMVLALYRSNLLGARGRTLTTVVGQNILAMLASTCCQGLIFFHHATCRRCYCYHWGCHCHCFCFFRSSSSLVFGGVDMRYCGLGVTVILGGVSFFSPWWRGGGDLVPCVKRSFRSYNAARVTKGASHSFLVLACGPL